MRSNGVFERTNEISCESNQCPNWLDKFARTLAQEEEASVVIKTASKTAVEVVRDRAYQPSVYEMMSSIISAQKPKYSSVEEAVLDYQKRTGLTDYIKANESSKLKSVAQEILAEASEDEECEEDTDYSDISDDKKKDQVIGKGQVIDFFIVEPESDDVGDVKWDPSRDSLVAESIIPKTAQETLKKPEILQKNPAIETFIENMLDTNYGIQVPALLHSIVETFGRDGISQQIFADKDLLNYINSLILSKNIVQQKPSAHLGRGVGTKIEYSGETDSNKDPFILLTPNKNN